MRETPLDENDEVVQAGRAYLARLTSQPLPSSLEAGAPFLKPPPRGSWRRRTVVSLVAFAGIAAVLTLIVVGVGHSLSTRLGVSTTPSASVTPGTPTPEPTPPPGGPVPSQLAGDWLEQVSYPTHAAELFLDGTNFEILFDGTDNVGMVVVNGNEIDFFNGYRCSILLPGGVGRYQWSVQAGTLHLTAITPDPCSGRSDALKNQSYTKKG
jgi:hypothetical protein